MARNGSGTYSLVAGNPVVTGTTISSTWANNTLSDIATALTGSLAADGQTTPTSNIKLGGFKLTGVGAATAATDGASLTTVQNSQGQLLGTIAGTNTITAQATTTLTAYAPGQTFRFAPAGTNTGATTINIDTLGAKNIFYNGAALTGGEIPASGMVTVTYDGTQFNLTASAAAGSSPFSDAVAIVKNSGDATKKVILSAASVTTATTRTVTVPDKNGTMAMTSDVIVGVNGNTRNAKMSVTTASATGTFTADEILVEVSLGGAQQLLTSYSQSVNLGTTGAGGMDTGTAPINGFVSLYAIAKADGTKNILACAVATSIGSIYAGANMPASYTYSALIAICPTNGSSQFQAGYVLDRKFFYQTGKSIFTGTAGAATLTSQSISAGVPAAARSVDVVLSTTSTNLGFNPLFGSDATGTGFSNAGGWVSRSATFAMPSGIANSTSWTAAKDLPIITSQTIFWAETAASTDSMTVMGYSI